MKGGAGEGGVIGLSPPSLSPLLHELPKGVGMNNPFAMPDVAGGVKDFWDYMRVDRPHRWPALGLAIVLPIVLLYFFLRSINPAEPPHRTIIYVQSWRADRSDFDVRHDWLIRAREANDRNEKRRNAYGSFARSIGQEFDATRANQEFTDARAQIDKALADLAYAKAHHLPLPALPHSAPPSAAAPHAAPAPATPAPAQRH